MAFSYEQLLAWKIPEIRQDITPKDAILYALGIGLGSDPCDPKQLRYVYEDALQAFPTMAVVLGYPGFWMKDPGTGIDWVKVVHGEQGLELHRPLPTHGTVVGKTDITQIIDKGLGKGAIVETRRRIYDASSDELLATVTQATFCRGDGGCGGPGGKSRAIPSVPDREPDRAVECQTLPQAALLYRLNGDYNPLHADPVVAKQAGFERPILHGLCTYGSVAQSLFAHYPQDAGLKEYFARFSGVVYPGDILSTRIWEVSAEEVRFQTYVGDRLVLTGGRAVFGALPSVTA